MPRAEYNEDMRATWREQWPISSRPWRYAMMSRASTTVRVLVDDVDHPDRPAVAGLVGLIVQRPDLIGRVPASQLRTAPSAITGVSLGDGGSVSTMIACRRGWRSRDRCTRSPHPARSPQRA